MPSTNERYGLIFYDAVDGFERFERFHAFGRRFDDDGSEGVGFFGDSPAAVPAEDGVDGGEGALGGLDDGFDGGLAFLRQLTFLYWNISVSINCDYNDVTFLFAGMLSQPIQKSSNHFFTEGPHGF